MYRSETSPVGTAGTPLNGGTLLSTASFSDTTAVSGTLYHYVVTAVDTSDNESLPSAEVQGEIGVSAPAAPTGLAAVAGNGRVELAWDANAEPNLAGYNVYRSTTSPVDTAGTPLNGGTLLTDPAFTDDTVVNEVTYHYAVVAVDDTAVRSPASAEVTATPSAYAGSALDFDGSNDRVTFGPAPESA